ncbi:MAG: tetraacyldisaccharide 4'-kinase [Rhabdochlamydiaceae bacterium]
MKVEEVIVKAIKGKKYYRIIRPFLFILSCFFQLGVRCRRKAYKNGFFDSYSSTIPIISVGNITAGGNGKTPVVDQLLAELKGDIRLGLISRGYKAKKKIKNGSIPVCQGNGPLEEAQEIGDEPFWLSQRHPHIYSWIGNKYKSLKKAEEAGCALIVLDDGLQSLVLKRDIDIVVMDAQDVWGTGYFLPRGFLRDSPFVLSEADLVVLNHSVGIDEQKMINQIRKYTQAPLVFTNFLVKNKLAYKKSALFCAIGKPEHFYRTVTNLGSTVVHQLIYDDHACFSLDSLQKFADESFNLGAECLVCTEKDHVKLPKDFHLCLPIVVVEVSLEMHKGKEHWDEMILCVKRLIKKRLENGRTL